MYWYYHFADVLIFLNFPADKAYRDMRVFKQSQSLIVSGMLANCVFFCMILFTIIIIISNSIMLMLLGRLSFVFEVKRCLALALNHGVFSLPCELIGTFPFNLQQKLFLYYFICLVFCCLSVNTKFFFFFFFRWKWCWKNRIN